MTAIDSLPVGLLSYMRSFARRRKWQRLIVRLGLATLALVTFALVGCLLDRIVALPGAIRLTLLLADLALAGLILWPAMRRWSSARTDWRGLAQQIERHDPSCGERLLTVTSRVLGKVQHAGSRTMLDRVARELAAEVDGRDVSTLLPAQRVVRPWVAVAVMTALALLLSMIPVLDLPALLRRFVLPLSSAPPVTTTRLAVTPGDVDLVEGQLLQVRVSAKRLGNRNVTLSVRRPGQAWTSTSMSLDSDATFVSSLGEVDDDVQYLVSGGDARSDVYLVRVLRKPVVTEFRIRYEYPAYTGLPPADVTNRTGVIEGPPGTKATIHVHASEPLAAATLTVGEQSVLMTPVAGDPAVRQAAVTIRSDQKYELGMSSTRGMVGSGPSSGTVRATPDNPPDVRILWPAEDLWLEPGAIVNIGYQASDDFGIGQMEVHARVNPFGTDAANPARADQPARTFGPPVDLTVRLAGDPRQQVGEFPLDLAALKLAPGDFVSLRLRVQDRNGHSGLSETVHVVASPRSVTDRQRRHVAALARAAQLADELANRAGGPDVADVPAAADRLQLWLMRALHLGAGGRDADSVQALADRAQQIASRASQSTASRGQDQVELDAMIRQTAESVRTIFESRRAMMLLTDMENLATVRNMLPQTNVPPVNQARRRVERLWEQLRDGLQQLQLRLDDPQVRDRLRRKVDASLELSLADAGELSELTMRWHDELLRGRRDIALPDRLDVAARAQTIRRDSDLIWARDLQRAATAALNLQASVAVAGAPPVPIRRFASALGVLQRDYRQRRTRQRGPWQLLESDETATARQQIAEWASEPPIAASRSTDAATSAIRQIEALVMQASAETVLRNFSNALAIDRALMGETTQAARSSTASRFATAGAERAMGLVQALDALVLQQDAIERQLQDAPGVASTVASLAERQEKLAQAASDLAGDQPRPHDRARLDAADSIAALDRWLAALPAEIAARDRLSEMTYELEDQAQRVRDVLAAMEPFVPDTTPALAPMRGRLLPSLIELQSAAQDGRDAPQIVGSLPQLVDETRSALADALDAILHPDPLLGAQFRTARAAKMMAGNPVQLASAHQELAGASAALRRAWHDAVHDAAVARAVRIPALARIVWPDSSDEQDPRWAAAELQRPRSVDPGPAPQGYEDAVNAYLEATGQRRAPGRSR